MAYPVRALVIECGWQALERGEFGKSEVTASQAMGSALGWMAAGLPVLFAIDHERAGQAVSRMLFIAARRRWREARELISTVTEGTEAAE